MNSKSAVPLNKQNRLSASQARFLKDKKHEVRLSMSPSTSDDTASSFNMQGMLVKWDNFMINYGRFYIALGVWLLAQILCFSFWYNSLWKSSDYATIRSLLSHGLPVARAAANMINLNCAFILLTVCRVSITWLRSTFLNAILPFDNNIDFHVLIGLSIGFWSLTHTVAHYINYHSVQIETSNLVTEQYLAFSTGPGITGLLLVVILTVIVSTSFSKALRKAKFEVFWYTHHLFLILFALTCIHGAFCFIKTDTPNDICHGGPTFWKWILGPLILYSFERGLREFRGRQKTEIIRVIQHPSRVYQIQFRKPGFHPRPGQYVFLCVPEISPFQWHPLTLTSANWCESTGSSEGFHSVHIRAVGDWTNTLASRLGCQWTSAKDPKISELPLLMVDGPYGTASQDVYDYPVSVLIGAGIGVTPYVSILKNIWYRFKHDETSTSPLNMKLKKVYFIWVIRDRTSFEWIIDVLNTIEQEKRMRDWIEIHSYLTESMGMKEIHTIATQEVEGALDRDPLTGLRARTHYGRPNMDRIFKTIRKNHPGKDVGVFYCGPKPMSRMLLEACNKWTEATSRGTKFYYQQGE